MKVIGVTANYVTEELDDRPSIEQDVERIGRDIERTVLARAVRWHLEDRVVVYENKTVVFE